MVCTKMVNLYEKYKLEWMVEHSVTVDELMRELDNYRIECEQNGDEFDSITQLMDSWEADSNGFDGEIWACYDEWQDNEFFEELCDRVRDKARINWGEEEGQIVFCTPVVGHEGITLNPDDNHDDWGQVIAEFILYGDWAVKEDDATDKVRSVIIEWLWLNDEKGGAY